MKELDELTTHELRCREVAALEGIQVNLALLVQATYAAAPNPVFASPPVPTFPGVPPYQAGVGG